MYVYLIQSGNKPKSPVKIGMSDHPERRLKQLQTGNPVTLRIVLSIKCKSRRHAFDLERAMHDIFKGNNIINEWYSVVKSKAYKALNAIANNPEIDSVINEVGLFAKTPEEVLIESRAKKRMHSLIRAGEIEERTKRQSAQLKTNAVDMERKLAKRKLEAKAMRAKLAELGFTGSVDELIGRK